MDAPTYHVITDIKEDLFNNFKKFTLNDKAHFYTYDDRFVWFYESQYDELALYYKALAGFESLEDLPMPHSRESSLVRKLLNSSYELGFGVNENSSRNERYLWDLINGTSTMLTNVPKSDTEKFLHAMIGGTVEEYPVVDTELDYWMDKCVHYMNSNERHLSPNLHSFL